MKLCECGCGLPAPIARASNRRRGYRKGEPKRFVRGHAMRGRRRPDLERSVASSESSGHHLAKKVQTSRSCRLATVGGCKGRIEVHHRDGDVFNNTRENLIPLCVAHHRLVGRGRIDLDAPRMPAFIVDGSGKRRYFIA